MYTFRALDSDSDWNFGKGKQDLLANDDAILLNIKTRLQSFYNDCFFDTDFGIDWFNLLEKGQATKLLNSISSVIASTIGVSQVVSVEPLFEPTSRVLTITYSINTVFSINLTDKVIL